MLQQHAFVSEKGEAASAIHNAFEDFDFVDGSLGKTIAEIGGDRVHHSIEVLSHSINKSLQFRHSQRCYFVHPRQKRVRRSGFVEFVYGAKNPFS